MKFCNISLKINHIQYYLFIIKNILRNITFLFHYECDLNNKLIIYDNL